MDFSGLEGGLNPFVSQVGFFRVAHLRNDMPAPSLNPFVSQVGFFWRGKKKLEEMEMESLNPFVSQVGFFHLIFGYGRPDDSPSQSLRKSGRFLRKRI